MATHYSILAWRIPWTEEPILKENILLILGRYNFLFFIEI